MKRTLTAAALISLASPALAGGPAVVAADPVPVAAVAPAAVHDWSGPYIGLAYGKVSGDLDYTPPGAADTLDGGSLTSLFAGYLFQRGNLVYGGELAYSRGKDTFATGFPLENVDTVIDLKGKIGYASNRALFYGVLGYSKLDYSFELFPALDFSASGVSYGVGVDFAATERLSVGLEYLARTTDGDVPGGSTADIDLNSLSLRIGYSF